MKKTIRLIAALLVLSLALVGCGGAAEKKVTAGTVENGTYTNEYIGIRFEAPDWTILGAQDLQDNMEDVNKLLEGTEAGDMMENLTQFMDMQAMDSTQMLSANVVYTKMSSIEAAHYAKMDDDAVIEETLKQKDMMMESYAQAGVQVESLEKCDVFFGGRDRVGMKLEGNIQGVAIHMVQVMDVAQGRYNVVTTVSSVGEDRTAELAEMFEGLNA